MRRKPIQVVQTSVPGMAPHGTKSVDITVLCNDGTIFTTKDKITWIKLPDIPQDENASKTAIISI